jgi:hypothetical protein
MKPRDIAIIGVRLVGFACILIAVIYVVSCLVFRQLFASIVNTSDLHLRDTYYLVYHNSLVPCGVTAATGVCLLLLSRRIRHLIARGMKD